MLFEIFLKRIKGLCKFNYKTWGVTSLMFFVHIGYMILTGSTRNAPTAYLSMLPFYFSLLISAFSVLYAITAVFTLFLNWMIKKDTFKNTIKNVWGIIKWEAFSLLPCIWVVWTLINIMGRQ